MSHTDNPTKGNKARITSDSPYYKWATELMAIARVPQSFVTMRIAEQLEEGLPGWLESLDWCGDCEERCDPDADPEPSEAYLAMRGYQ